LEFEPELARAQFALEADSRLNSLAKPLSDLVAKLSPEPAVEFLLESATESGFDRLLQLATPHVVAVVSAPLSILPPAYVVVSKSALVLELVAPGQAEPFFAPAPAPFAPV
jgi:hypothetical protein